MRWLPRSLAGQLLALLVLALAVTHLLAVLILSQGRTEERMHPVSSREIDIHIASVYNVLRLHPEARVTLLADLSQPESRFELLPSRPAGDRAMNAQEATLAQGLRQRLGMAEADGVVVRLHQLPPDEAAQPAAWVLDVEIGLPDGAVLRNQHWPTMMHAHWDRVLAFSIPVGLMPIVLIAFLFGRRIMRPLKAVREAAGRLSRGEAVAPIRPQGPADVQELALSFNEMQERLHRFVQGRTKMIATIGHDLRTPLTSLRIRAELIDDAELRAAMIATLDEMSVMAEETLRFARDDAAQEATQEVDLGGLVNEVVGLQRSVGHAVRCVAPAGILYRCRPVGLKRALSNLLENAVRHGQALVTLRETAARQGVLIEVEDEGPGIPPDQFEHVFEPFVRLDAARNRAHGGTGLGLAIARSSIRAHGGEVSLQNKAGGGLRAVIALPR